jgi:CubicO group peptidase (beta-lactamase class C family)
MRGGIPDYDELYWQLQPGHLNIDIGPEDSANLFGSVIQTPAGTCGVYSSMGYVLLGLILVVKSGKTWDTVDLNPWRHVFPHVDFGIHGTCSKYVPYHLSCGFCQNSGIDMKDMSCTNGYTSVNIFARTSDTARYLRMLFTNRLLNESTVKQMTQYQKLGNAGTNRVPCYSWADGMHYGLGVQNPVAELDPNCIDRFIGHTGAGYAASSLNAYDTHSDLAISTVGAYEGGTGGIWFDIHNTFAAASMECTARPSGTSTTSTSRAPSAPIVI